MKILYLCTFYHRAMIFRDSMNYLEKLGHDLLAFNAVAEGTVIEDKYEPIMDEKVIHKECFRKFDRFLFFNKQKKIRRAIEDSIKIRDFDLIHSHTLFNGGWASYKLREKYGIPYIVSVRNTDLNFFLRIPFFKYIARKIIDAASGVQFLSHTYLEEFIKKCYSDKEAKIIYKKCSVIPNGLEPFWIDNLFVAGKDLHNPLKLLYVGKIDKRKNLETTLKVVNRLNEEGIAAQLTVIGKVLDDNIKNMLDKSVYVSVIPFLKKDELMNYYRQADVFIMPSFAETFGRVYAEAMTQGLPVIYTRGQGFDGIFADGVVGFSVKADDVEEIKEAVKKIMNNYHPISQNCIDNCNTFNWDKIAKKTEELYFKALEGGQNEGSTSFIS